eukprot:TRINITY_DN33238_c0_g1_i1.p1 TRINITY_DN33238_c0_g1~~TRINITY_DN33238_c0_g1_i1.p1  ORF type:complete len:679 (+),score=291.39 TRINITY_DN33238_c0_g1_i1:49-2085(+)
MRRTAALRCQKVSLRCFDCLRPDWLFWGVDQSVGDDASWYERVCLEQPLREPVTGTRVHVLGTSPHNTEQAALRRVLRELASRAGGVSVAVAAHSPAVVSGWSELAAAASQGHDKQEEAAARLSATGVAPDELAEAMVRFGVQGLEPCCDAVAAVAEARRLGAAVHYVDRPPLQGFARVSSLRGSAADLLQVSKEDVAAGLYTNEFGMHSDHEAHLLPDDLAEELKGEATPHVAARVLSCWDLPTLLFRVVQPTIFMARQLRELCWRAEEDGGRLLAVVPAPRAQLLRRLWQDHSDHGRPDAAEAGVFFDFGRLRNQLTDADVGEELDESALGSLVEESTPPEQLQAEFEVQLALFHHLTAVRPDVLAFQSAVANVYIVHGMIREGIEFLCGMVERRVHPELPEVLVRMAKALVDNGMLSADDDLVRRAFVSAAEFEEWLAGNSFQGRPERTLLPPPENREVPQMPRRSVSGKAAPEEQSVLPEVLSAARGEGTEQRKEALSSALMEVEQNRLARSDPTRRMEKQLLRRKQFSERTKFNATAIHPLSDAYETTPGADLPSQGVLYDLPEYQNELDFPPRPGSDLTPTERHVQAVRRMEDRMSRPALGEFAATRRLIGDAEQVRKKQLSRSSLDSEVFQHRREEARRLRQFRRLEREERRAQKIEEREALRGNLPNWRP